MLICSISCFLSIKLHSWKVLPLNSSSTSIFRLKVITCCISIILFILLSLKFSHILHLSLPSCRGSCLSHRPQLPLHDHIPPCIVVTTGIDKHSNYVSTAARGHATDNNGFRSAGCVASIYFFAAILLSSNSACVWQQCMVAWCSVGHNDWCIKCPIICWCS